ncbi:DUF285 domain containing protein [Nitzschia inconspicua]|uniref:DUF285 domain containing protein n=1 Tax=Nitzschia inconspicua TaxID=303405 RepID=A0A9K3M2I6_9STRA|nr:DUF285 domain containing protein [Nitzschia inconspicua]
MFEGASIFNSVISNWVTSSSVTNMGRMFIKVYRHAMAIYFHPIHYQCHRATNMALPVSLMFDGASLLDQYFCVDGFLGDAWSAKS